MGIRPSKVLPSPILSLAPSSSGHVGVCENGYATPRSRGRPALYRVARTPYSRVHVTSTLKVCTLGNNPVMHVVIVLNMFRKLFLYL